MDEIDFKILEVLRHNARLPLKDIGKQVGLSSTPVYDRIKKMEKKGVILRYTIAIDPKKIGEKLSVFCQVRLIGQTASVSKAFESEVIDLPEVVSCHFVTGEYDYLLHVMVSDMEAFHLFHRNKLGNIKGVSSINSIFVMNELKNTIHSTL